MDKKRGWDLLLRSVARQQSGECVSHEKRKNKKPEKETEKEVVEWAKKNNLFLHVVEAKATYSVDAGRYVSGQAESGYPDLSGNTADGHSVWIELKAKGKRATLRPDQYNFLSKKIEQGCFSVVVDSAECLSEYYYTWMKSKNREAYLKSILPYPSILKRLDDKIDPEMGF